MLNDKLRAEMDQATAIMAETLPPLWRGLYLRCVEVGFSEEQALSLVRTYILTLAPGGVNL